MKKSGFSIIELVIVIAVVSILTIITIIGTGVIRGKNRDAQRLSDISVLRSALQTYYNDIGIYPTLITAGQPLSANNKIYLQVVPTNPSPVNDGNCATTSAYTYSQDQSGASYHINFCLGNKTNDLVAGMKSASPNNIVNYCPTNEVYNSTTGACVELGTTWTLLPGSASILNADSSVPGIMALASSSDGAKIVIATNGDKPIWRSTDGGATFTYVDLSGVGTVSYPFHIASSTDASVIAFTAGPINSNECHIFVSVNSGATWSKSIFTNDTSLCYYSDITVSATGQYMAARFAGYNDPYVSISSDYGASWTDRSSGSVSSAEVVFIKPLNINYSMTLGIGGTNVMKTTDFYVNTNSITDAVSGYASLTSSADFTKIAFSSHTNLIRYSTDSGATWSYITQTSSGLAYSADGSKLFLIDSRSNACNVYVSYDYGATFNLEYTHPYLCHSYIRSSSAYKSGAFALVAGDTKLILGMSDNNKIYTSP